MASGALEAFRRFSSARPRSRSICFETRRSTIAVLEVGLGGRLDATNIVSPIAAAIVSIDFDHEAQLGHTLAAIAAEKAGIVRRGIPVVCGRVPDEALRGDRGDLRWRRRTVDQERSRRRDLRDRAGSLDVRHAAFDGRRRPPGFARRAPGAQRRRRASPAGRAERPRVHDGSRCGARGPHASRVARTARAIHDRRVHRARRRRAQSGRGARAGVLPAGGQPRWRNRWCSAR